MVGMHTQVMNNQQQQRETPVQAPPWDKHSTFLNGNLSVFTHSANPMDVEDWLRTVERELDIARKGDGSAQEWWEAYRFAHRNPSSITWQEFKNNFRMHHVPDALRLNNKIVSEYRDKFIQLSRYAPEEVDSEPKRQRRFMKGLVDPIKY
ncbi:hypothetical protein U9M48_037086 [Paspalum notatum var. saurae]|uniref:Retrotransposon gag domain-containing protein n=1 Tax=Paspalum notatum var. saurae TaxID=547442 RepID=A0AAQ3UF90_PASNO